jgi:DNA-binding beta-propeller fold protein YncE
VESANGLAATSIGINPNGIAVGPDGALYIASGYLFRVDPDRRIYRLGGRSGRPAYSGDEGPAVNAGMNALDVAVGPDGSIYIADNFAMLRKITPDGIIHRFAGLAQGAQTPLLQSGQPATSGALWPQGLSVALDGTVLTADMLGHRAWRIAPNGTAIVLAGNGTSDVVVDPNGPFGSTIPPPSGSFARAVPMVQPFHARVAADGSVLVNDYADNIVWRAEAMLPRAQTAASVIPSQDGGAAYVFEAGRHTRTVDALTGATLATLA